MKSNVAGQFVGVDLINIADGLAFTGTARVAITIDNGTQSTSPGGSAVAHKGRGFHTYDPTQAETNGARIAFTFDDAGGLAVPRTVQVYTSFPQTGDSFALANGASGFVASKAVLDTAAADVANIDGASMVAEAPTAAAIATELLDRALSGHQTVGSAGRALTLAGVVISETTASGTPTTTTLILAAGSAVDDYYNDMLVIPTSGALTGQARPIADYEGATKTITIDEAWTSAPSNGDSVLIKATHVHPVTEIQAGLATSAALATAQADLDIITGASGVNLLTATQASIDAIEADTNELQTDWTNGGRLDLIIDAILADTGTDGVVVGSLGTDAISAAAMSTAAAQEVADALLDRASAVDTYTPRELLRLMGAALIGKLSGAGTGTEVFRDAADAKARITATTDSSGNRSAIVLDATA